MGMKRCVQCGILKQEEAFRKYTYSKERNTQGRYRICRDCEALNSKYKRALAAGSPEALQIRELYQKLEDLGYRTPLSAEPKARTKSPEISDTINQILMHHNICVDEAAPEQSSSPIKQVDIPEEVPDELQHWLETDMDEWLEADLSPEFLQETIYESLKAKYRPQKGIDRERFIPIYDDTYRDVLNMILRRFDEYEEKLSAEESIEPIEPEDGVATNKEEVEE